MSCDQTTRLVRHLLRWMQSSLARACCWATGVGLRTHSGDRPCTLLQGIPNPLPSSWETLQRVSGVWAGGGVTTANVLVCINTTRQSSARVVFLTVLKYMLLECSSCLHQFSHPVLKTTVSAQSLS